ncbi:MAG TPA: phage major capsid protein [Candidatus Paceibacterota bacterium]
MPATMTTVSSILKEVYEGTTREQLNNDVTALRRIEKTSEGVTSEVGGKYVTFPIHVKRNAGIGARAEGEVLPTAGNQGLNAARVNLKYLYGAVRLTGQTFELANSNFQAFASALDTEMTGMRNDLAKDLNRQVFGAANAVLAVASAGGTGSAGANPFNVLAVVGAQYLEPGQIVDVYDTTQATLKASARTIVSVNYATGAVIYDGGAVTTIATDVMVRSGNGNLGVGGTGSAGQREVTGFAAIVNNTTLYNINPGTEPKWQGVVAANGGTNRALSEGLMIQQVDAVRQNGGKVSVIFTNLGVRRAYFNLLTQQRRFSNTMEFEGGFTGLAFTTDQGDLPVVVDVDCQYNTMYFLDEKNIKVYRAADWEFMNRDGSNWQRVVSGGNVDAYDATLYSYQEIGTHRRNGHAVLKDITEG